jgi:hypothetical protein
VLIGSVVQMEEHFPSKEIVGGSNPSGITLSLKHTITDFIVILNDMDLWRNWLTRHAHNVKIGGSSPSWSTKGTINNLL